MFSIQIFGDFNSYFDQKYLSENVKDIAFKTFRKYEYFFERNVVTSGCSLCVFQITHYHVFGEKNSSISGIVIDKTYVTMALGCFSFFFPI